MLLKPADNKNYILRELETLMAEAPEAQRSKIERELRIRRAGVKGEEQSSYLIDFDYRDSDSVLVIHDLRLVFNGRTAQIDHLLMNRFLDCFVLETKHFHSGFKITEEGEFLRWNDYAKRYEGMASPLAQNDRHIAVLRDAFERIDMPTRLGVRLAPRFHSYVLVSPDARIDRPQKLDTSHVIKADVLRQAIGKYVDSLGVLDTFAAAAKMVSTETMRAIGEQLVSMHKPVLVNVRAELGIAVAEPPAKTVVVPVQEAIQTPPTSGSPGLTCRHCGKASGAIVYGKYGYYFKCAGCDGNTNIKLSCGPSGHQERLRKDGRQFFRECTSCGTSSLYYVNPS